jgi:hypothetical protein
MAAPRCFGDHSNNTAGKADKMNITKYLATFSVAAVISITGMATSPASATDDQVCGPLDSGKIDTTGDPATVSVTAPAGQLITGYCVKAGSVAQVGGGPVYISVDPPVQSITLGHPSGKDLSHYSVSYTASPTTPTTPPTTTPTTPPTTPETVTPTTPPTTPETVTPTTPETVTPTASETVTPTPSVEVSPSTASVPDNGGGSDDDSSNKANSHTEVVGQEASAGNEVLGQPNQNQNANANENQAPATSVAGQEQAAVPTSINAGVGVAAAGNEFMVPAGLAALGALLGLFAVGDRRRRS